MAQFEYEGRSGDLTSGILPDDGDYRAVLKSYRRAYRSIVGCGNDRVQSHCNDVIKDLDQILSAPLPIATAETLAKPVTRYLQTCLDQCRSGPFAGLAKELANIKDQLSWDYGYSEMPDHLSHNFAYSEIMGTTSRIHSDGLAIGLVLFGPGCYYPPHGHPGITESYLVVSGTVSQNDFGIFGPGSLIFNPPGREHMITVDAMAPALLAYAWAAEPGILAANEMILSRD